MSKYNLYQELMYLISRYDWAVEGYQPSGHMQDIEVEDAIELRNKLVKMAGEIEL